MFIFKLARSATFLLMFCGLMTSTVIALGAWTLSLTAQVATLTSSAASAAIQNRKAISQAVLKTKAKARLRRVVVMLPFAGIAAAAAFERADFVEWQEGNPNESFKDYACEIGGYSAELVSEVLLDVPEKIRPSKDRVLGYLPNCETQIEN